MNEVYIYDVNGKIHKAELVDGIPVLRFKVPSFFIFNHSFFFQVCVKGNGEGIWSEFWIKNGVSS